MGTLGTHARKGRPTVRKLASPRAMGQAKAAQENKALTEILRVISSSPGNLQLVFDTILSHARRLCGGSAAALWQYDGTQLCFGGRDGGSKEGETYLRNHPLALGKYNPTPQAALEKRTVHVLDVFADRNYRPLVPKNSFRNLPNATTVLAVPLLRQDELFGVISIWRFEKQLFTRQQVAMVEAFASQAAMAIHNVRLHNETKEALERQTATSEILRVISSSPTDVQPVFDAIARSAVTLCGGMFGCMFRYDGQNAHFAAHYGFSPEALENMQCRYPRAPQGLIAPTLLESAVIVSHDVLSDNRSANPELHRALGVRGYLSVPMLLDGHPIGAISVWRREPGPFSDAQIAVLQTFADQAVIAIENVRLFNETKEALERQTATAEILKVISKSPSNIQPVFDAVAESAARLCDATDVIIRRIEGGVLRAVAHIGSIPLPAEVVAIPVSPENVSGRAAIEGRTIHINDVTDDSARDEYPEAAFLAQRGTGFRTLLVVPLVRNDVAVGLIAVRREEKRPFSDQQIGLLQTFADQAVIAIQNVRLFNETKEALEQQTAISEVLRVISNSPTDVKPVLDAVASRAARICDATDARIFLVEGKHFRHAAGFGDVEVLAELIPLNRDTPSGRSMIDRVPQHVDDIAARFDFALGREIAGRLGWRTILSVPMLREDRALGTIVLRRKEVRPFSDKQVALLKTFADQAAIAIENVRLFNELRSTNASLREALEQQTATSELLKVIGRSNFDLQPVFETLVENAVRLCVAERGFVFRFDGQLLRYAVGHNVSPELREYFERHPITPGRDSNAGRAAIERRTVHNHDVLSDPEYSYGGARVDPYRTVLAVPMFRADELLGVIVIYRHEVRPFTEDQIALMETFADQAAIAIENVRLFNETKEALERQTATAEILNVISSSPTDVQPVFETIARNAVALCGSMFSTVFTYDGELMHFAAQNNLAPHSVATLRTRYPRPPDASLVGGRAILTGDLVRIEDTDSDPNYDRRFAAEGGWRRNMAVPMLRDGKPVGAIVVAWADPGPIPKDQEELLKTFADQAVIAIENVRLFKELEHRTEALTKSVDKLTALGEVGQAISSTLDLDTVLKTIVSRAVQLTGLDAGAIYEYDEPTEQFHLRAAENISEEVLEVLRSTPIRKGEGAVGGTALAREPIQVPETQDERYKSRLRDLIIRTGRRALLAVPLMREDHIVGALAVQRNTPGPFAPEVVELLKTFATQSALAIQNARLFREIAEKGRQLEVASHHKSQFLASMSHELRTPLNALLGFNEMILGEVYGEVPGDMKPPLAQMQSSGKHLLGLINNVLDLAKIEAGRMELALSDYSVHDTVESVRSALRPLAADKGLELLAAVPEDIPLAYGDPGRITQCLMNLAGNSLKFTKAGKVEISVRLEDALLRYSVADTGVGIPADKIESLFTEFKQTDATIASEYGGTGLGLSITKKFVEMHGGRIWVESEPGRGSTFSFEIPLRAQEAKAA
jgi:GAF domain-containing protein